MSTYDSSSGYGSSSGVDNAAGGSGSSPGSVDISRGGIIAIIVVVVVVGVFGISMAVLFYLTKKKEWKLRERVRRSAKRVVTALTPRRSDFPRSVKDSTARSTRGPRIKLEEVPPTPRLRPEDVEKGLAKAESRRAPEGKSKKWTRK